MRVKIVVFSGSGVSKESGIDTYRDKGGIWDIYDPMKVATIDGWHSDPSYVLEFHNLARKGCREAVPNSAHYRIAELEKKYDVVVITQNVDDLHERAGSSNVIHLHGNIFEGKSSDPSHAEIIQITGDINIGDSLNDGKQLRPNVVWFGEEVPNLEIAIEEVMDCDKLIIIGTSLMVFPANQIINYLSEDAEIYLIDPEPSPDLDDDIIVIDKIATLGMEFLTNYI